MILVPMYRVTRIKLFTVGMEKVMTVSELISILEDCNPNSAVWEAANQPFTKPRFALLHVVESEDDGDVYLIPTNYSPMSPYVPSDIDDFIDSF